MRIVRPVLIAGPTASGKSAMALTLAERDRGTVINADALQVYEGWRVLTARPGPEDEARAPHALYGYVRLDSPYSVGHWLRDVAAALSAANRAGRRPVIVGGTGLYFTALTEGLAPIPTIPAAVRARADALVAARRVDELRDDLARRDPESHAAIDLLNPVRVQRAWEVLEATGTGLIAWQRSASVPLLPQDAAVRIVVSPDTMPLNARIAARFHAMVRAGALEECRALLASGWDPRRPSSKALGAAPLIAHLRGELSLEAAIEASVRATRRFAKRQRTWFRGRMADWQWHSADPSETVRLVGIVPRS